MNNDETLLGLLRETKLPGGQSLLLLPKLGTLHEYHIFGITQSIEIIVRGGNLSVLAQADENDFNFDCLWDGDVDMRFKKGFGWYCKFCEMVPIVYFPTRRELLRNHTVIPFLQWFEENLRPERFLVFHRFGCGSSEAVLVNETEVERKQKEPSFWKMERVWPTNQ